MKFSIFLALISAFIIFSARPIIAQNENDEATQNIINRLTEGTSSDKTNVLSTSPKAFVGTVQDIVQQNISIATKDGQKIATPKEDVIIVRTPGNKEIDVDSIQIDDYIIAMGYLVSQTKLETTRIIVSQSLTSGLNKTTGRATVQEVLSNEITLSGDSNDSTSLSYNNSTIFKDKNGVIDEDEIEEGSTIIYTAKIDSSNNMTATIVMLTGSLTSESDNLE